MFGHYPLVSAGLPKPAKADTEPAEIFRKHECMLVGGSSHLSSCSGVASRNCCAGSDPSVAALIGQAKKATFDERCRRLLTERGIEGPRSGCSWVVQACIWARVDTSCVGGETIQVPTDGCLRYMAGAGLPAPSVPCSCTQGFTDVAAAFGAAIPVFSGSGSGSPWVRGDGASRVGGETTQVATDGRLRYVLGAGLFAPAAPCFCTQGSLQFGVVIPASPGSGKGNLLVRGESASRIGGDTFQVATDGCLRYVLGVDLFAPAVPCFCTHGVPPFGVVVPAFPGCGSGGTWVRGDAAARIRGETIHVPTDGCLPKMADAGSLSPAASCSCNVGASALGMAISVLSGIGSGSLPWLLETVV